MVKKFFKFIGILLLIYIVLCLMTPYNKSLRKRSIKNQVHYLSHILDKGYDDVLQKRFPEGKLFSNCLLALSIIEFSEQYDQANPELAFKVDRSIQRIQSEKAQSNFDKELDIVYGVFYQGWSNLLYSSYIKSTLFKYSAIKKNVISTSEYIESRIEKVQLDSLRILDSYRGSYWPADNMIAVSSLTNDSIKVAWIDLLKKTSTHPSGLIHHAGRQDSVIRGSSSAMIAHCLLISDFIDATGYNERFKEIFVDRFLEVQLVKEHEAASGLSDIDSGPIVFGYGASATIMNIKTQASFGDQAAKRTWAAFNLLAVPVNVMGEKFFLFKEEPMLDLFMLWASVSL